MAALVPVAGIPGGPGLASAQVLAWASAEPWDPVGVPAHAVVVAEAVFWAAAAVPLL